MSTSNQNSRIEGSWVISRIRVPYADTDRMGHVYYANYLVYFEIARSEYMRALGYTYRQCEEDGTYVPVVQSHVDYKGRVFYDDLIEVSAAIKLVKNTRMQFNYQIHRTADKQLVATGWTMHATVNEQGKPTRVPKKLIDLIRTLPELGS